MRLESTSNNGWEISRFGGDSPEWRPSSGTRRGQKRALRASGQFLDEDAWGEARSSGGAHRGGISGVAAPKSFPKGRHTSPTSACCRRLPLFRILLYFDLTLQHHTRDFSTRPAAMNCQRTLFRALRAVPRRQHIRAFSNFPVPGFPPFAGGGSSSPPVGNIPLPYITEVSVRPPMTT